MIIYIWALLTLPYDRNVCTLWVNQPPDQAALIQSCGTDVLDQFRIDVTRNGVNICSAPASTLQNITAQCALTGRLDSYQLHIVEPNYVKMTGCVIETTTPDEPTEQTVREICHTSEPYQLQLRGTRQPTAEDDHDPMCKLPPISQPDSITTTHELYLLAGKLIWYGFAKPHCPQGFSGVDPSTFAATPCGMDGARSQMIAWQNSMDSEIMAAAQKWNVPADLLKQMIERETQFWTWTNSPQEHGLIQATDYAAFAVLHSFYRGYYVLTPAQKDSAQTAWLRQLDCIGCTPLEAIDHAKQNMSLYAQVLAAYYCMTGSWDAAVHMWNVKY